MPETRGYQTINDRTLTEADRRRGDTLPEQDAPFEPPMDDDSQPGVRNDVYDESGNIIIGVWVDEDGNLIVQPGAQRRWTRELEQRFSRVARFNPDIEDRARTERVWNEDTSAWEDRVVIGRDANGNLVYAGADGAVVDDTTGTVDVDEAADNAALGHTTEIHAGRQDAYDNRSYSATAYNRPAHQGEIGHLEGDFFQNLEGDELALARAARTEHTADLDEETGVVKYTISAAYDADGTPITVPAEVAQRDRLSGYGVTKGFYYVDGADGRERVDIEFHGAGEWNQGAATTRGAFDPDEYGDDATVIFPDTTYGDATLPNDFTEHETDYISPDADPIIDEGTPLMATGPENTSANRDVSQVEAVGNTGYADVDSDDAEQVEVEGSEDVQNLYESDDDEA